MVIKNFIICYNLGKVQLNSKIFKIREIFDLSIIDINSKIFKIQEIFDGTYMLAQVFLNVSSLSGQTPGLSTKMRQIQNMHIIATATLVSPSTQI